MNQPTQPRGDFYANLNRYKQPSDDKPIFAGTLTKPDDDAKLPFALWAFEYTDKKTGEVKRGYSGSINGIATNIPAADQIAALAARADAGTEVTVANLTLRPGQIVLFENGFKAEDTTKNRPDLWGWVNPNDGTPAFRPSVWIKQYEDSGRAYLSGTTQYPIPGQTEAEMQRADDGLKDLLDRGEIAKGMPKPKKERAGRG